MALLAGDILTNAGLAAEIPTQPVAGIEASSTSATGYITVTHGAGFTPSAVVATGRSPISGATIAAQILVDSVGATTFRARVLNADGSVVASTSVSFHWAAFP